MLINKIHKIFLQLFQFYEFTTNLAAYISVSFVLLGSLQPICFSVFCERTLVNIKDVSLTEEK